MKNSGLKLGPTESWAMQVAVRARCGGGGPTNLNFLYNFGSRWSSNHTTHIQSSNSQKRKFKVAKKPKHKKNSKRKKEAIASHLLISYLVQLNELCPIIAFILFCFFNTSSIPILYKCWLDFSQTLRRL